MREMGLGIVLMAGALSVYAQDGLRGHWTGSIQIPGYAPVTHEVDLDRVAGNWIGSLSFPTQNSSGIPLEAITYTNGKCSFRVKGMPGDPTYTGTLSADGQVIEGDYTEGSIRARFRFTRTGEPRVEVVKMSPKVAKEFLGSWEGTLNLERAYRMVLKISNDQNGAWAVLISVDDGGAEVPVSNIEQRESALTFLVKPLAARYVAEINKEGSELNGTFTLAGNDVPLNLKKVVTQVHKD
ncbi:MAG: hypothetical protein ABSD56_09245 [Bryobacteraceae bacterium]